MRAVSNSVPVADARAAATTFTLAGRKLLLATDGSPASGAAIHVAHALAREHHADVHVLHVADMRPVPLPPPIGPAVAFTDSLSGEPGRSAQKQALRERVEETLSESVDWTTHVALGTPARSIVQEARNIDAALIVLGLRRHGRLDRVVHDETTLSVMRSGSCPVLGVATGTTGVPKRVLAAVDFSPTSIDAARVARAIMRPTGTLVLAYAPPAVRYDPRDGEREIRELGVQAAFTKYAAELRGDGLGIDNIVLHREMDRSIAELLLDYADGAQVDMISVGSTGQGRIERWLLGSVSADLVRDGRHTVLVVPPQRRGATSTE